VGIYNPLHKNRGHGTAEVRPLPTGKVVAYGQPAISPDGTWIVENSQDGPLFMRVGEWRLIKWETNATALGWRVLP
jgi:hypothetical protein